MRDALAIVRIGISAAMILAHTHTHTHAKGRAAMEILPMRAFHIYRSSHPRHRSSNRSAQGTAVLVACAIACLLFLTSMVRGQCAAGGMDVLAAPPLFNPPALPRGTNGRVNASVAWDPDGDGGSIPQQLVIGGTFTQAGGATVNRIARWDGSRWIPLGNGFNGTVHDLAVVGNTLYAAGAFTQAGGLPTLRIAQWTGVNWMQVGDGFNNEVFDVENHNGQLHAGGKFTLSAGTICNHVARFDGVEWMGLTTAGTNGDVYALRSIGLLYIGGSFTTAGGTNRPHIASWNSNTSTWGSLGNGTSGTVTAIERGSGNEVFVGGSFANVNGNAIPSRGVGLWNSATLMWTAAGISGFTAYALHRHIGSPTESFASGSNGSNMVYKWNGASWTPVGSPAGQGRWGYTMSSFGGELVVGGLFDLIAGGPTLNNITRWHNGTWHPFVPVLNGVVNAFANFSGRLIVGGDFSQSLPPNGEGLGHLLGWDGETLSSLGSTNGTVTAVAPSMAGPGLPDLIVGGVFTLVDGVPVSNIARRRLVEPPDWSGLGQGFTGSGGLTGGVFCIAAVPSSPFVSTLYAGGLFTHSGTTPVSRVARFDGTNWQPMGAGLATNTTNPAFTWANDMLVYHVPDGGFFTNHLIVGGLFDSAGGITCNSIARWTGTVWASLGSGVHRNGSRGEVSALTLFNDGADVIVGGEFDTAGSTPANNIARWTGSTWQAMGAGIPGGSVSGLAVVDGVLFASALFENASGDLVSRILRWNGFAFETVVGDFDGFVYDLFPYQGRLHVGGSFNYNNTSSYAGGVDSPYWIQLACACAADANGDGTVDVDDLIEVILEWGACPNPPAACDGDVNDSGDVDVDDLIAVILGWGACS
jgi:hypothetical protein